MTKRLWGLSPPTMAVIAMVALMTAVLILPAQATWVNVASYIVDHSQSAALDQTSVATCTAGNHSEQMAWTTAPAWNARDAVTYPASGVSFLIVAMPSSDYANGQIYAARGAPACRCALAAFDSNTGTAYPTYAASRGAPAYDMNYTLAAADWTTIYVVKSDTRGAPGIVDISQAAVTETRTMWAQQSSAPIRV